MRLIIGKAAAAAGNERYPMGEIHAFVMILNMQEDEAAKEKARESMLQLGWDPVVLHKMGPVDVDSFHSEKPYIQGAFNAAKEAGIGISILDHIEESL